MHFCIITASDDTMACRLFGALLFEVGLGLAYYIESRSFVVLV
jgi:hypothetical protein